MYIGEIREFISIKNFRRDLLKNDIVLDVGGRGIKFKGGFLIGFYADGVVKVGVLAMDTVFRLCGIDVSCSGGIEFWDDGVVKGVHLVEDTVFRVGGRDVEFGGGDRVVFGRDGLVNV